MLLNIFLTIARKIFVFFEFFLKKYLLELKKCSNFVAEMSVSCYAELVSSTKTTDKIMLYFVTPYIYIRARVR